MASAKLPTPDELKAVGRQLGMTLSDADVAFFLETMGGSVAAYHALEAMVDPMPRREVPAHAGYRPEGEENKYNAWYYKSEVKGAPNGKLKGKRVALKDNVCLAGVPMMNGASTLEGYVPDVDATIVTRILDAGGTIMGKVHCEYFCFSGGSHTQLGRPRAQPAQDGLLGGRLVVGERGRGGGRRGRDGHRRRSGRLHPHAVGVLRHLRAEAHVGARALHRRLPHREHPRPHGADDRQRGRQRAAAGSAGRTGRPRPPPGQCEDRAVHQRAHRRTRAGMKIAVVKEGFGLPNSEADVDAMVKQGRGHRSGSWARRSTRCRSRCTWPDSPSGRRSPSRARPWQMMNGNGYGFNWKGLYVTSLIDAHSAWRQRADEFSDTLKTTILFGQYALNKYRGHYYAKAQNLARTLTAAYDAVLKNYDLLLMPTLPLKATPIPKPGAPRMEIIQRAFEMLPNTAPIDVTGHPVHERAVRHERRAAGRHDADRASTSTRLSIYRAASAFEKAGDWKSIRP